MAVKIHPTAIVSSDAKLGEDVSIGPYCIVEDNVVIGDRTELLSHVVVKGPTRIGQDNKIFPFASLGSPPQDIGYMGEDTILIIGDNNIIREYVTINRATTKEEWKTTVGSNNYIMAYAHIAHDCRIGNNVILSNLVTLAGHIHIDDYAILGGVVAVHQFVRIGRYAFIGGKSGIDKDVPPFMLVAGERAKIYGINQKGLIRAGFSQETIERLKKAFRILWKEAKTFSEGMERVRQLLGETEEILILLDFLKDSKRGILSDHRRCK